MKFWRCKNRSCNVILRTNLNDEFIQYSTTIIDNCHLPDPADHQVRDLKRSMKKRAATELVSVKEIAEQEMRKALLTGEALAILPSAGTVGLKIVFLCNINMSMRVFIYFRSWIKTSST